jgi:Ras-related protein Rab-18
MKRKQTHKFGASVFQFNIFVNSKGGDTRFREIVKSLFRFEILSKFHIRRGASGVILVYDITDRSTFENLSSWKKIADTYASCPSFILVGNKIDLSGCRQVTEKEGKDLAHQWGAFFSEISVLHGDGVQMIFQKLVGMMMEKISS